MSQHDYVIANASGATVRADINNVLLAITSMNSGSSEPSTTYAYELWLDTSNSVIKLRNAANNGWITLGLSITASNTVDINGGAIDGTAIGANSASTGAFTSITGSLASTITTADNTDTLSLISTDADSNVGPNLRMYRNSGSPGDGDNIGYIGFVGENSTDEAITYAEISSNLIDVTNATEDGGFGISTIIDGTMRSRISLTETDSVFNDAGLDINHRIESNGNANMLFVDGGADRIGINESAPSALLHANLDAGSVPTIDGETVAVFSNTSAAGDQAMVSIIGGATGAAQLNFGDTGDENEGYIQYNNSTAAMRFSWEAGGYARFVPDTNEDCTVIIETHSSGDTRTIFSHGSSAENWAVGLDNGAGTNLGLSFAYSASSYPSLTGGSLMYLTPAGDLGIGLTNPAHKVDVVGTAGLSTGTAWTNTSDERVKTNIETIADGLETIKKLRPVSFNYTEEYVNEHPELDSSKKYNSFIAQEYAEVFPNAVNIGGNLEKVIVEAADGEKGIAAVEEEKEILIENLLQFTPHDLNMYLVAAIKELETRLNVLES